MTCAERSNTSSPPRRLTQRRAMNAEHGKARIEIIAKPAAGHRRLEIAIRRGHEETSAVSVAVPPTRS